MFLLFCSIFSTTVLINKQLINNFSNNFLQKLGSGSYFLLFKNNDFLVF